MMNRLAPSFTPSTPYAARTLTGPGASAIAAFVTVALFGAVVVAETTSPAQPPPAASASSSSAPVVPTPAATATAPSTRIEPAAASDTGASDTAEDDPSTADSDDEEDADVTESADTPADPNATPYDELPANPKLVPLEPKPPRKRNPPEERGIDLGAEVGVSHRTNSGSSVTLSPALSVGAHLRIAFIDWLGLSLAGSVENHSVEIASEAFGFQGLQARHDDLRILSLSAELDPRLRLSRSASLHLGVGLGWNRLEAGAMRATDPVPFWLPPRTGVALDATLSPRVAFRFWSRAGLSLGGRLAVPVMQSGDVFASGNGDLQTVRQDTGMLLSVGGHPELGVAFGGHLSFDVFF